MKVETKIFLGNLFMFIGFVCFCILLVQSLAHSIDRELFIQEEVYQKAMIQGGCYQLTQESIKYDFFCNDNITDFERATLEIK